MNLENYIEEYEAALLSVDQFEAKNVLDSVLDANSDLKVIEEIVYTVLEKIGTMWESGEVSLAQIYMAGQITEKIMEDYFIETDEVKIDKPKMAICVLDDYHSLGKSMVISVIKSNGYLVTDYGHGLTVDEIVDRAIEDELDVLLVSTLMIASAMNIKNIRKKLDEANSMIKLVVGGAPFRLNNNLWKEVGAYATSAHASGVIDIIKEVK